MSTSVATAAGQELEKLLIEIGKSLDIPSELYVLATEEYERLAHFLEQCDERHGRREPKIYPQGSIELGTATKPVNPNDDVDVDLVYERYLQKSSTTQYQLKAESGEHLRDYLEFRKSFDRNGDLKLKEGARCWTIEYPMQFHMDVLPAIPDFDQRLENSDYSDTAIVITDRDAVAWQSSNPKGFAAWFRKRMQFRFDEIRRSKALNQLNLDGVVINERAIKSAAEAIPHYEIKTPLQMAIQILKRHRDIRFQDNDDNRPASILITTLAAMSYDNEASLIDALFQLLREMPTHIEDRVQNGKRIAWVQNPINEDENFADRWQDKRHPLRETEFRNWLTSVTEELEEALRGGGIHRIIDLLGGSFGTELVNESAKSLGFRVKATSSAGGLSVAHGTGAMLIGTNTVATTPVRPHTFFGV